MHILWQRFLFLIVTLSIATTSAVATTFAERAEVQEFIHQMVHTHHFKQAELTAMFKKIRSSKEIINRISKPYEEQSWQHYRLVFITQQRIQAGVAFWQQHQAALQKAERVFGVPAEIIVAIIGVETFYGRNKGQYLVLEALATLAFDYPKRAAFFKSELEQFLLLTREQRLSATKLRGSYAGAIGYPQFIASSYRNFAVDFAKAGKIDLLHNVTNAIGSVANYFKVHGWQYRQPVADKITLNLQQQRRFSFANMQNPKPNISCATLRKAHIYCQAGKNSRHRHAALIQLNPGKQPEHWLAYDNFYVITRYNHSVHYAMAVYQLSKEIAAQYQRIKKS